MRKKKASIPPTGSSKALNIGSMMGSAWDSMAGEVLAGLEAIGLGRRRQIITPVSSTQVLIDGREYLNFASNDYLGLSRHPRVLAAMASSISQAGAGAAASPLITGYTSIHAAAEEHIARWKGTQAAVLLPSGYQANQAAIQTLALVAEKCGKKARFILDKLCHASLIDAVQGAVDAFRVFPHNHLPKLDRLLEDAPDGQTQIVVTESIFSMDGDAADLPGLIELKRKHSFTLLLDEAHATGVYGPAGSGLAAELALRWEVDVSILTLSKSIGCAGGAICGTRIFCDAVVNLARAYIYSTSLAPALAAGTDAAISVLEEEPAHQVRLRELAARVRGELKKTAFTIPSGDSPIIPIILGSESAAMEKSQSLREQGILVLPIRPPTVPRGTSRLRITLSSAHRDEDVDQLIRSLNR